MRTVLLKARRLLAAALLLSIGLSAKAADQDVRRAYDAARLCFVANGRVSSSFKDSGDSANAQLFEDKGKKAFDLTYFYGNMLRLSRAQVSADLDTTTNTELRKLVADSGYLTTVAKMCKSRGLM